MSAGMPWYSAKAGPATPAPCPVTAAASAPNELSKNSGSRSIGTTLRMTAVVAGSSVTTAGSGSGTAPPGRRTVSSVATRRQPTGPRGGQDARGTCTASARS